MRVQRMGERIHEGFEHVVRLHLVDALEVALVTLAQQFLRLFPRLVGQFESQYVVFHPLAPDLVQLGLGLCPGFLGAVELVVLLDGEVRLRLELRKRKAEALTDSRLVDAEHLVHGVQRLAANDVVELVAIALEKLDIAVQQIHAIAVQRLDIAVHDARRQFVVNGDVRIVGLLYELGDQFSNALVPWVRLQPVVIHRRGCHQRQSHEAQQRAGNPAASTVVISVQGNLHSIRLTLFHSSSVG